MFIFFKITLLISLLIFFNSTHINAAALKFDNVEFLQGQNGAVEKMYEIFHIPKCVVYGVIIGEQTLNVGIDDNLQDLYFKYLLETKDDQWWSQWLETNLLIEIKALQYRNLSNRWPMELVKSGYVVSFGVAQLTPRTVLSACKESTENLALCSGKTKEIIGRIFEINSAIQLVSVVLNYEAIKLEEATNYSIKEDVGRLASAYSAGSEYFLRYNILHNALPEPNYFGKWVQDNAYFINRHFNLKCEHCSASQDVANQ